MTAIADTIGLAALAGVFGLTLLVFWPIADIPPLLFAFLYLALAVSCIFVWHHKSAPESPIEWVWFACGSVVGGAVFFAVDILIGHFSHPDLPLLEAGTKVGGMFGFLATLAVCPGGTFVCVAGWARSFFLLRARGHA